MGRNRGRHTSALCILAMTGDGDVGRWNGRKAFVLRGIAEKSSECESSLTESRVSS